MQFFTFMQDRHPSARLEREREGEVVGEEAAVAGVVVRVDGILRLGAAGVGADESVVGGEGGGRRRSRVPRRRR